MRIATRILGALLLAAGCEQALAHHSAAMFDDRQCHSVDGTVRNFQWQYPHSWLWVVVPNGTEDEVWGFELPPSGSLARSSVWSRHALQIGDKVTVRFSPLRDGRHAGLANAIVLSGNKVLHGAPNAFACEEQYWRPGPSGSPVDSVPK